MNRLFLILVVASLMFTGNSLAMEGMDHGDKNAKAMEGMNHGAGTDDGNFTHTSMAGGMHTEFTVMELASMNMTDPTGKTHHVMATFMRDGEKVAKVVGKMKLVSPSKKEQTADLKDFGGGIFAANFTIDEPGKWGVICLFKDEHGKQTVKFWYPHMEM